jgi:hypothetical protein
MRPEGQSPRRCYPQLRCKAWLGQDKLLLWLLSVAAAAPFTLRLLVAQTC